MIFWLEYEPLSHLLPQNPLNHYLLEDRNRVISSGGRVQSPAPRNEDELTVGVDVVEEYQVRDAAGVGADVLQLKGICHHFETSGF